MNNATINQPALELTSLRLPLGSAGGHAVATSVCILGATEGLPLIELHPGAAGAMTTDTTKLYSRKFHEYIPA